MTPSLSYFKYGKTYHFPENKFQKRFTHTFQKMDNPICILEQLFFINPKPPHKTMICIYKKFCLHLLISILYTGSQ